MKDEDIKAIKNEIEITEERLKILKSIMHSNLEINLLRMNHFKHKGISYKLYDDYIIAKSMLPHSNQIVGSYIIFNIMIKERNINSSSFDEYISYSSKMAEKIKSKEILDRIESNITNVVREAKKNNVVFKTLKKKPVNHKFTEQEIESPMFTFSLIIIDGKVDLIAFISFSTRVDDENVAQLSIKLKITIDPFGDEFVIHNTSKDIMSVIEVL
jgi:hypothetical protein